MATITLGYEKVKRLLDPTHEHYQKLKVEAAVKLAQLKANEKLVFVYNLTSSDDLNDAYVNMPAIKAFLYKLQDENKKVRILFRSNIDGKQKVEFSAVDLLKIESDFGMRHQGEPTLAGVVTVPSLITGGLVGGFALFGAPLHFLGPVGSLIYAGILLSLAIVVGVSALVTYLVKRNNENKAIKQNQEDIKQGNEQIAALEKSLQSKSEKTKDLSSSSESTSTASPASTPEVEVKVSETKPRAVTASSAKAMQTLSASSNNIIHESQQEVLIREQQEKFNTYKIRVKGELGDTVYTAEVIKMVENSEKLNAAPRSEEDLVENKMSELERLLDILKLFKSKYPTYQERWPKVKELCDQFENLTIADLDDRLEQEQKVAASTTQLAAAGSKWQLATYRPSTINKRDDFSRMEMKF